MPHKNRENLPDSVRKPLHGYRTQWLGQPSRKSTRKVTMICGTRTIEHIRTLYATATAKLSRIPDAFSLKSNKLTPRLTIGAYSIIPCSIGRVTAEGMVPTIWRIAND